MKTESEWLKFFPESESSGLTQEIFCKQKGVSYWKFYKHRRDLVKRGLLKMNTYPQPFEDSLTRDGHLS